MLRCKYCGVTDKELGDDGCVARATFYAIVFCDDCDEEFAIEAMKIDAENGINDETLGQ